MHAIELNAIGLAGSTRQFAKDRPASFQLDFRGLEA